MPRKQKTTCWGIRLGLFRLFIFPFANNRSEYAEDQLPKGTRSAVFRSFRLFIYNIGNTKTGIHFHSVLKRNGILFRKSPAMFTFRNKSLLLNRWQISWNTENLKFCALSKKSLASRVFKCWVAVANAERTVNEYVLLGWNSFHAKGAVTVCIFSYNLSRNALKVLRPSVLSKW